MDTTILYYTDGRVNEPLASSVLNRLTGLGLDVVQERNEVNERSHLQLFKNIQRGLKRVTTKYVAMGENDCLYPDEHFMFIPPDEKIFYYNLNVRYVVLKRVEYNTPFRQRMALSGLICGADILREAVEKRVELLETGKKLVRGVDRTEFGFCNDGFVAEGFKTEAPYLDVRHGRNFTGLRKGKHRTLNDRYWGEFQRWINYEADC